MMMDDEYDDDDGIDDDEAIPQKEVFVATEH